MTILHTYEELSQILHSHTCQSKNVINILVINRKLWGDDIIISLICIQTVIRINCYAGI